MEDNEKMVELEDGQEVPEEMLEAILGMDVEAFLTELMLYHYLLVSNGYVEVSEDDMEKLEEMRKTRVIEFSSEATEEGKKKLIAKFIYKGKETDEEEDNNN